MSNDFALNKAIMENYYALACAILIKDATSNLIDYITGGNRPGYELIEDEYTYDTVIL